MLPQGPSKVPSGAPAVMAFYIFSPAALRLHFQWLCPFLLFSERAINMPKGVVLGFAVNGVI